MNNLSKEEVQLITILRDLKPFEVIEIKVDENRNVIYTHTRKERYTILTLKK